MRENNNASVYQSTVDILRPPRGSLGSSRRAAEYSSTLEMPTSTAVNAVTDSRNNHAILPARIGTKRSSAPFYASNLNVMAAGRPNFKAALYANELS